MSQGLKLIVTPLAYIVGATGVPPLHGGTFEKLGLFDIFPQSATCAVTLSITIPVASQLRQAPTARRAPPTQVARVGKPRSGTGPAPPRSFGTPRTIGLA